VPEGDTVHRAARHLHAALAGDVLTAAELRVPQHATAKLAGGRVDEVVPRGKHLLMRLHVRDEALTIHSHLRMEGVWLIVGPEAQPKPPLHEVRAVLRTDRAAAIGRLLGELDLVRTADEHRLVGHLGPDLLDPAFDAAEAIRRLSSAPERPVAEALLDQRNLAGLGNELVTEICFLRGLSPWSPIGDVDLGATVDLAVRVIAANATRSVRSTTGDLRRGRTSYVFGREGRSCRRCGSRIVAIEGVRRAHAGPGAVQRMTWWCPACQPGPAGPSR
jgi:endonuclease-8